MAQTKPEDCEHLAWTAVVMQPGDDWIKRTCDECGTWTRQRVLVAGQSLTILLDLATLSAEGGPV